MGLSGREAKGPDLATYLLEAFGSGGPGGRLLYYVYDFLFIFIFILFYSFIIFSTVVSLSSHFILCLSVIVLCICYCNVLPFLKFENKNLITKKKGIISTTYFS